MPYAAESTDAPLRILHVLRAPVGGLFRHVQDLAREQIARGHAVGIIADSLTGGEIAEGQLAALRPHLALGLLRLPIHRLPHPSDVPAALAIARRLAGLRPDVVHGHGSKGGVYARLAGRFSGAKRPVRVYTPHGGSLNYEPGSMRHRLFMKIEGLLAARTDALLFESAFIAGRFERFVGRPKKLARVILNGISASELAPVEPRSDAADLLYIGEFRHAKGVDTLIDAVALLARRGVTPSVMLIGDGPDRAMLEAHANSAGVAGQMIFGKPCRARDAFALGKAMVVPSRFESLPYVVLEAAGARVPLVATNVGGMPEIFGAQADRLIPANDPERLADALLSLLTEPAEARARQAQALADHVASRFALSRMADEVLASYRAALRSRRRP